MNNGRDVLVLAGTRTAIGKYGGALAAVPPCDLGATVVREAVSRAGVEPGQVGHTVFGNVIHTETRDMYLGRVVVGERRAAGGDAGVHAEPAVRHAGCRRSCRPHRRSSSATATSPWPAAPSR